jgi:hypothetical protein
MSLTAQTTGSACGLKSVAAHRQPSLMRRKKILATDVRSDLRLAQAGA